MAGAGWGVGVGLPDWLVAEPAAATYEGMWRYVGKPYFSIVPSSRLHDDARWARLSMGAVDVVAWANSAPVNMAGEHNRLEVLQSSASVEGKDTAVTIGLGL